jgi:DNA-directed RNA polymerase subunit omega
VAHGVQWWSLAGRGFCRIHDQPEAFVHRRISRRREPPQAAMLMRDDYLQNARKVISDPNILVNVVSRRVKQLRRGSRPLVVSLEKLAPEDIALREIVEGKITYRLPTAEELAER